jgi:circadian clock protein KaiB
MKEKKPAATTKKFEAAVKRRSKRDRYTLRLFVTGATPRSIQAIQNIRAVCEEKLAGRYDLEVVDIYQLPEMAKSAQLLVAPTLIKDLPLPVRRLIGDLADRDKVLAGLGIVVQIEGGEGGEHGRGS